MRALLTFSVVFLLVPFSRAAGNLETAKITFIQKEVAVADLKVLQSEPTGEIHRREALLNESITRNNAVVTGHKSRAELEFNDGTITRLGQLTSFAFTPGTRNLQVSQGTALLVVPKGQRGTSIQAGPVTAAITGTTLLVQVLGGRVIIYVYEGSVKVGGAALRAGQVVTVEKGVSAVNRFDTAKGIATAAVFTKFIESPSTGAIERQIGDILKNAGVNPEAMGDKLDRAVQENAIEQRDLGEEGPV